PSGLEPPAAVSQIEGSLLAGYRFQPQSGRKTSLEVEIRLPSADRMRCAVCHGDFNGWKNVAGGLARSWEIPNDQRLAIAIISKPGFIAWQNYRFKETHLGFLQYVAGIIEAISGFAMTVTGVGSGLGVAIMFHGVDNATSGFVRAAYGEY